MYDNKYSDGLFGKLFWGNVDRNGIPVTRTKFTHPYSYDTFVLWKNDKPVSLEHADGCDSDRLYGWNWKHYNKCCREVWNNEGQHFDRRDPKQIEQFLRLYFQNDTIVLNMMEEWCNASSGYPGWHFTITYNGKTCIPENEA